MNKQRTLGADQRSDMSAESSTPPGDKVVRSDDEWRRLLAPAQYDVLRRHHTEYAFTGQYWDHKAAGTYLCAGCGHPLFDGAHKYDSGTGWPSFWQPISTEAVETTVDTSFGMRRVEVHCARCEGHLGHIFDDGPQPTGLRYCINSAALDFKPA